MTIFIAIVGALALRLGLCTAIDSEGHREFVSPGLAGSGAAAMLAVAVSLFLFPIQ